MGQPDVVDGGGDRAIWGLTGFLGCLLVSTKGGPERCDGRGSELWQNIVEVEFLCRSSLAPSQLLLDFSL